MQIQLRGRSIQRGSGETPSPPKLGMNTVIMTMTICGPCEQRSTRVLPVYTPALSVPDEPSVEEQAKHQTFLDGAPSSVIGVPPKHRSTQMQGHGRLSIRAAFNSQQQHGNESGGCDGHCEKDRQHEALRTGHGCAMLLLLLPKAPVLIADWLTADTACAGARTFQRS